MTFQASLLDQGVPGSGCWSQVCKSCPQITELIYPTSVSDLTNQKRTCASSVSWKWDKNQKWAMRSGTGTETTMGAEWWQFSKIQATLRQLLQPCLQPIILTKQSFLSAAPLFVLPPWRACSVRSSVPHVKGDSIINCAVTSCFGNVNSRLFPQWLGTVWLMLSSWWD